MGIITVSDKFCTMLKMLLFHAAGDLPTSTMASPTFSFTLSNIPERLLIMPPIRISRSQSTIAFLITSIRILSHTLPREAGVCGCV